MLKIQGNSTNSISGSILLNHKPGKVDDLLGFVFSNLMESLMCFVTII
jgi:hypothetical protein